MKEIEMKAIAEAFASQTKGDKAPKYFAHKLEGVKQEKPSFKAFKPDERLSLVIVIIIIDDWIIIIIFD